MIKANLGGAAVGLRCEEGLIAAVGPSVTPDPGRRGDRRRGRATGLSPDQRAHPCGDDPVPRLRRRSPADALARGADLAARGEARGRRRLLGNAARLRRDDPYRDGAVLGHVLAGGGQRPGGPRRGVAGDDRRAADRRRTGIPARCATAPAAASSTSPDSTGGSSPRSRRTRSTPSARTRCAGSPSSPKSTGVPVQIHLSETEAEVERCLAEHGVRPAHYLDRLGLLGPRILLAHGVWLDGSELELIAERGATVVSNPVANMKLAVGGVFPLPEAQRRGVAIGLGTDGAGSNNSLDLFSDLKALALIQKHTAADPLGPRGGRGLGDRHRRPGRAARRGAARGGRAGRLPAAAPRLLRARPRRCRCGPRLRRDGLDRRHHRGRRTGADARRGRPRRRGGARPRPGTGGAPRDRLRPHPGSYLYPRGV